MFPPQWNPHHSRSLGVESSSSHAQMFFFKIIYTLVPHPGTKLLKYSFNIHQPSSNTGLTSEHSNEKCFTHFSFLRSCNQMHAELQLVCIGLMFAQEFANDGLIVCRTLSLDWIGLDLCLPKKLRTMDCMQNAVTGRNVTSCLINYLHCTFPQYPGIKNAL